MRLAPSLSRFVEWTRVLNLYGIVPQTGLPCTLVCPWCQSAMTIYRSLHTDGERFACYGCDSFGDMIELAGRYYSLDVESTIRKLMNNGLMTTREKILDYDIRQYLDRHINRLQRYAKLWNDSRTRLITNDNKEYRTLRQKLGVDVQLDADRWLDGPGKFLGGSLRTIVDEALWPCARDYNYRYIGSKCIFKGGGWNEVLCVPFEDVPGHIKSFWFLGRNGDLERDTAFQLLRYDYRLKFTSRDTGTAIDDDVGLAMWYSTAGAHPIFGRNVFVVNDLPLAIRLHCLNYLDNTQPIPLVSMHYRIADHKNIGTEYSIWQHFAGRQILFIGSTDDIEIIRHAQAANGMLFFDNTPDKKIRTLNPTGYLQMVQRGAKLWDEALIEALSAMPPLAAEGLFLKINFAPDVKCRFLTKCPTSLRTTISPQTVQEISDSTIVVDSTRINESRDGWRDARTGELLSNVVIRTDEIVYTDDAKSGVYHGRIIIQGVEHPFVAKSSEIEPNPYKWLREHMVSTGIGLPLISTRWRKKLLDIAHRFKPPVTRTAPAAIGWDEATKSFIFPRFIIGPRGRITKMISVFGDEVAPGDVCHVPEETLTPAEAGILTADTPFNALALALLDCILYNLVAPITNATPFGIAISGQGSDTGLRIAELLGCVRGQHERYKWPRLITGSWTDRPNGVTAVDELAADALSCQRCWFVLRSRAVEENSDVLELLPKLVPGFLRWLSMLDWRPPGTSDLPIRIRAATVRWFNEHLNTDKYFSLANRKLVVDTDGEQYLPAFMRLICRLFTDGEFGWVRVYSRHKRTNKPNLLLVDDNPPKVGIPKACVNSLLTDRGIPPLNMPHLSARLCKTGIFSESIIEGASCLVLSEADWNKYLSEWRTNS